MASSQPEFISADGRRFAGIAAAVLVFIVDPLTRRFLLLSSPAKRPRPGWETVNGGVEAGETLLAAVRREVAEEAGPSVRLDVLGTVHAWTWRYDDESTAPHLPRRSWRRTLAVMWIRGMRWRAPRSGGRRSRK